jgi:hypothetical protein
MLRVPHVAGGLAAPRLAAKIQNPSPPSCPVHHPVIYYPRHQRTLRSAKAGDMTQNLPYYGDNPDGLRRHVPDATVDLVYLDPTPKQPAPPSEAKP